MSKIPLYRYYKYDKNLIILFELLYTTPESHINNQIECTPETKLVNLIFLYVTACVCIAIVFL